MQKCTYFRREPGDFPDLLTASRDTARKVQLKVARSGGTGDGRSFQLQHCAWSSAPQMGRPGQSVRSLRRHRRHGDRHQRRGRPDAASYRRHHGRAVEPRHSAPDFQPADARTELEPGQPWSRVAGIAERGCAQRSAEEDAGDPEGHPAAPRRDQRARRRQERGRPAGRNHQEHQRGQSEPGVSRTRAPDRRGDPQPAI